MSTALLVIDAQRIYTDSDSEMFSQEADKTVVKINSLVRGFEAAGDPIIYVRHVHKPDGSDLGRMFDYTGEPADDFNFKADSEEVEYSTDLRLAERRHEIIKSRYSAFAGTDLDALLKRLQVDTVVVCGFMTNFCCDSTAREAHDRDYFVDFILDATGTPGTENLKQGRIREVVGELLGAGYARVMSADEYLKSGVLNKR